MDYNKLLEKYNKLVEENKKLKIEIARLKGLVEKDKIEDASPSNVPNVNANIITKNNSNEEKVNLYLSLFKGRDDACAKRWRNKPGYSPYCYNDWTPGLCPKPKVKCTKCKNSNFANLDKIEIEKHLRGEHVLGLYPITLEDTCYLLAMDFDKASWQEDVNVIREVCKTNNIYVYAERSRSGNGCHLWFFFNSAIKASIARKFGIAILDIAMTKSNKIGFDSYDRLFPSQDFLQKDGFGNLIALPLQRYPRKEGNTVFVDDKFIEIGDQWNYLAQIKRLDEEFILEFIKNNKSNLKNKSSNLMDATVHTDKKKIGIVVNDFSDTLDIDLANGLIINKSGISTRGIHLLRSIASYSNPDFFSKQAMRMSTYGTPRVTIMYEEDEERIILPRGLQKTLIELLDDKGIKYDISDRRFKGNEVDVSFYGELREEQYLAFKEMKSHDNGVLSATTGFGKTVLGARLIAEKQVSTIILVHTRELALQWVERLEQFLKVQGDLELVQQDVKKRGRKKAKHIIGQLGGGKKTANGIIDVVLMQSMFERDKSVKKLIEHYGMVIVDECHHVSATNFNKILSETRAKYVYGLTATPIRKDGHHPIIFMQCGPIRYKVDAKKEAKKRTFEHYIIPRFTSFRKPVYQDENDWHISDVFKHICENKLRNALIIKDVEESIDAGRNPLLLTERASHIEILRELMSGKNYEVIELSGRLSTKKRKESLTKIKNLKDNDRFVIIATGKLIGEGFDIARLDTLFMAMPISWKGTIAQYAGRLHRNFDGKEEVYIYDYVDIHVSVLGRMYQKRLNGYRAVGYSIKSNNKNISKTDGIYNITNYFEYVMEDIKNAKNLIILSSPYIQKKKVKLLKDTLTNKYHCGVRVVICTKKTEEYSGTNKKYVDTFISECTNEGLDVIQINKNKHKFMVIDDEIIWYGGIDILGVNRGEESLIRIINEELGNELIDIIEHNKSLS
jgi:superfamily II DNA or RNA helicase